MKMYPEFSADDFQFLKSEYDIGKMLGHIDRVIDAIEDEKETYVCNALQQPYNSKWNEVVQPDCVTHLLKAIGAKLGSEYTLDGWVLSEIRRYVPEFSLKYVNRQNIRIDWLHHIRHVVKQRQSQLVGYSLLEDDYA